MIGRFDKAGEEIDERAEKAKLDEDVSVPSYQHSDHQFRKGFGHNQLVTIWVGCMVTIWEVLEVGS